MDGVSDEQPPSRRDPAWLWYALAATIVVALLALELTGLFEGLGPRG